MIFARSSFAPATVTYFIGVHPPLLLYRILGGGLANGVD